LGWTIDELAAASDLTRDSVSRFERGAFGMKAETQERVVAAFAGAGVEVFAPPRDGARRKS
jgi:transcriptional regulator with XRE-family HTH domain